MRWSERFAFREKVHERYPEVWNLKLVRKRLPYISSYIRDGESVLEIRGLQQQTGEQTEVVPSPASLQEHGRRSLVFP